MNQYPVNLVLAGRPCLVVGGGAVAARKVAGLRACGAQVHVVAPRVDAEIRAMAADGVTLPGAGAIVAALETVGGVEAEVVGKPNEPIFREALRRAGGGRPLIVGDRLDSDIEGALRLGWDSVLVLTGISTRDDVRRTGITPTYVVERLDLLIAPG